MTSDFRHKVRAFVTASPGGTIPAAHSTPLEDSGIVRPWHMVAGEDENGDLWTFSSCDCEAVQHIAEEFRNDAFRWVSVVCEAFKEHEA